MPDPTKVANTMGRGAARSGRGEQLGYNPMDVWGRSYDGAVENMSQAYEDPVGTAMGQRTHGVRVVEALVEQGAPSSTYDQAVDAAATHFETIADSAAKISEADGALATVGAVFGTLISIEQMISLPLSMIPFPAFPAIRVADFTVGLPHAHAHPPNLVPPNPVPVPFPNAGPIIPIPFISGAATVLINNMPAGRCGDMGLSLVCGGWFPMYEVFLGSSSVWVEGARAGRIGIDITKHCIFSTPRPQDPPVGPFIGFTVSASPNVLIGGIPMPSLLSLAMGGLFKALFKGLGKLKGLLKAADDVAEEGADAFSRAADDAVTAEMPIPPRVRAYGELDNIAKSVNPLDGDVNCGKIIDAVVDRLKGRNPNAVAPRGRNGDWAAIEARHGTNFQWGSSYDEAFRAVEEGGDGTTALVGIGYKNSDEAHVVAITNKDGAVGIIEGQGGGRVISSPEEAANAYGADSDVGVAVLP